MFCLPKDLAGKLKSAIGSGKVSPGKLKKMTSSERRGFLEEIVGPEAKQVNLLFEKKMLLKNQEKGLYDWAREVTGLSKKDKEAMSQKIKEAYAEKKRRVHEPKEGEAFLDEIVSDVYSKKFKTEVTLEEAQKITELSSKMAEKKELMNEDYTWGNGSEKDRLKFGREWGSAKVALDNYVGGLKMEASKVPWSAFWKEKGVSGKLGGIVQNLRNSWNFVADNSRAIVASLDNSLWMRQGVKTMTNPKYTKIWANAFMKSWGDIFKTVLGGIGTASKEVWKGGFSKKSIKKAVKALWNGGVRRGDSLQDALKAEIYSRKNYLNGNYERGQKLDIGQGEEEFPSSLPQYIPLLGRLFKASEVAYTSGAMRLRVDVADTLYKSAKKAGIDVKDPLEMKAINRLVNSLTGRGHLKSAEGYSAAINKAFFSAKFLKSNIDFLTQWTKVVTTRKGDPLNFAARQSAMNLLSTVTTVTGTLILADTIWPGSVEWDPTSSNFGKIRIGDTRFDITGGMGGLVILGMRMLKAESKSSLTGIVTKKDRTEMFFQFGEYKLSPILTAVKNLADGEDFKGDDTTLFGEAKKLFTPIPVQNYKELKDNPQSADMLLTMIIEGLGISQSTYSIELSDAEYVYNELKDLPEDEREDRTNELKENDPELHEELAKVIKSADEGLEPMDRVFKKYNVKGGDRAQFIYNEAMKISDKGERNEFIADLEEKGIVTPKVKEQLMEMKEFGRLESVLSIDPDDETRGPIQTTIDYWKAFGREPGQAWETLFGPEKLGLVSGNLVAKQRFYGIDYDEEGGSDEKKKELMEEAGIPWSERGDYKLEHITPAKGGGGSEDANLMIVPNADWEFYRSVDGYVARALKTGTIEMDEVADLMFEFKVKKTINEVTVLDRLNLPLAAAKAEEIREELNL